MFSATVGWVSPLFLQNCFSGACNGVSAVSPCLKKSGMKTIRAIASSKARGPMCHVQCANWVESTLHLVQNFCSKIVQQTSTPELFLPYFGDLQAYGRVQVISLFSLRGWFRNYSFLPSFINTCCLCQDSLTRSASQPTCRHVTTFVSFSMRS